MLWSDELAAPPDAACSSWGCHRTAPADPHPRLGAHPLGLSKRLCPGSIPVTDLPDVGGPLGRKLSSPSSGGAVLAVGRVIPWRVASISAFFSLWNLHVHQKGLFVFPHCGMSEQPPWAPSQDRAAAGQHVQPPGLRAAGRRMCGGWTLRAKGSAGGAAAQPKA